MQNIEIFEDLKEDPKVWLITGVAGFIGSNILEALLKLEQKVIGLDNFSTGFNSNLKEVQSIVGPSLWKNFTMIEGDICNLEVCKKCCKGVDIVLHQAALGSVPRSIENPVLTNNVNISGFLNIIQASKNEGISDFVYAASSSTYGDHPDLPKVEDKIGSPLSPYAVTKYVNEIYAEVFHKNYNFDAIGLRYFNVFGPRQSPKGAYAAVIPLWINSMILDKELNIFGDGNTSRDFCYVENVIQANILAATVKKKESKNQIYNIAMNKSTSLLQLFEIISNELKTHDIFYERNPNFLDFRVGDVRHSRADISKAKMLLNYDPNYDVESGIRDSINWYLEKSETSSL